MSEPVQANDAAAETEPGAPNRKGGCCTVLGVAAIVLVMALALAGHLAERHWQRRLDARLAGYRAAGQPVTWEGVLTARDVPPDEENSALVVLEAAPHFAYPAETRASRLIWQCGALQHGGARCSEITRALVRDYLDGNARALEILGRARHMTRGAYPYDPHDDPSDIPQAVMDAQRAARDACRACGCAAVAAAMEGDAVAAADYLILARRVAASAGAPPFGSAAMHRIGLARGCLGSIERVLSVCELPAERLRELSGELEAEEAEQSVWLAICGNRAAGLNWFARRRWRELGDMTHAMHDWSWQESAVLAASQYVPGWWTLNEIAYLDGVSAALAPAALPVDERPDGLPDPWRRFGDSWQAQRRALPVASRMPWDCSLYLDYDAEIRAELRVARVALALEAYRLQHGSWPTDLQALVPNSIDAVPRDPFADGPIRCVRAPNGLRVYSVGRDRYDNGGMTDEEVDAAERSGTAALRGWGDYVFHLLDPGPRGARTLTVAEECGLAGVEREDLLDAGFTGERLAELGLAEDFEP